jgi:hypothetical protein
LAAPPATLFRQPICRSSWPIDIAAFDRRDKISIRSAKTLTQWRLVADNPAGIVCDLDDQLQNQMRVEK